LKQNLQCLIFQHGTSLLQQMQHNCKLHNFPCLLSNNTICNLGINIFMTIRNKQFLVLSMLRNLQIIPIPFQRINLNIIFNLFITCMFIERTPLKKQIIFPFHLTTNSTLDSVQVTIWPSTQFYSRKLNNPRSFEIS